MKTMIAILVIQGTVPEIPYTIVGSEVKINKSQEYAVQIQGETIIVKSNY